MNFLDAYDVSGSATPSANQESEPSLNEEVSQVVGQLSRFWGGFRKQSQTAFESARKDLGQVVSQAQKEIGKLATDAAPASTHEDAEQSLASSSSEKDADASAPPSEPDQSTTPTQSASPTPSPSASQTLFARLQSSLPPNIVASVQSQLPESLKHARAGSLSALDFAQLRTTISTELQRVQGATEGYVQRSEELFREAGEFLKDAVRVVPPEEGGATPGVLWDGSDIWMLPGPDGSAAASGSGKGKERERSTSAGSGRRSVDGLKAVATRAEALLKQLRHDPEVIKADPEIDDRSRELYASWIEAEVQSKEDGVNGAEWSEKIASSLNEEVDGPALQATLDTLVPTSMSSETFWTRYFFRVHQVEREEERRKALIQGTIESEEDFSWEDDDDDPTSPTTKTSQPEQTPTAAHPASIATLQPSAVSGVSSPAVDSPRLSSEDSYDVVSSQVSNIGTGQGSRTASSKADSEENENPGDADDDDDDEEGEDGEGEEDSDWE